LPYTRPRAITEKFGPYRNECGCGAAFLGKKKITKILKNDLTKLQKYDIIEFSALRGRIPAAM